LNAARHVGPSGRVLAVEAHPLTYERLKENFRVNGFTQCHAVHQGLSDSPGALQLNLETGNSGANSFLIDRSERSVTVQCDTLLSVLQKNGVQSIQAAKFDLEGFEFRVLREFLKNAPRSLWPRFILVEHFPDQNQTVGGSSKELLLSRSYQIAWQRHPRPNLVFALKGLV
jgi:FkbM family methyltransferase